MSRLDDELREAFKRQEPAADFTTRVMSRIAEAPKPKPALWQRFLDLFSLATRRWSLATAALLLIAAVGVFQYQRLHRGNDSVSVGETAKGLQATTDIPGSMAPDNSGKVDTVQTPQPAFRPVRHILRRHAPPRLPNEPRLPRPPEGEIAKDKTHKSEGEIAKEQLYKALAITTNLLQEAKDIVITGGR